MKKRCLSEILSIVLSLCLIFSTTLSYAAINDGSESFDSDTLYSYSLSEYASDNDGYAPWIVDDSGAHIASDGSGAGGEQTLSVDNPYYVGASGTAQFGDLKGIALNDMIIYKLPLPNGGSDSFSNFVFTHYSGIGVGRFFKVPQFAEDEIASVTTSTEGISSLLGLTAPDASVIATSDVTTTDTGFSIGTKVVYKNEVNLTQYAKEVMAQNPDAGYILVGYNSRWSSEAYAASYYRLTGQGYLMQCTFASAGGDVLSDASHAVIKLPVPSLTDDQTIKEYNLNVKFDSDEDLTDNIKAVGLSSAALDLKLSSSLTTSDETITSAKADYDANAAGAVSFLGDGEYTIDISSYVNSAYLAGDDHVYVMLWTDSDLGFGTGSVSFEFTPEEALDLELVSRSIADGSLDVSTSEAVVFGFNRAILSASAAVNGDAVECIINKGTVTLDFVIESDTEYSVELSVEDSLGATLDTELSFASYAPATILQNPYWVGTEGSVELDSTVPSIGIASNDMIIFKLPYPEIGSTQKLDKYLFTHYWGTTGNPGGRYFKVPQVAADQITSLTKTTDGISGLMGLTNPDASLVAGTVVSESDTGFDAPNGNTLYNVMKSTVDLSAYAKECLRENPDADYFLVGYNTRWSTMAYSATFYRLTGQGYFMNYVGVVSENENAGITEETVTIENNPYLVGASGTSEINNANPAVGIALNDMVIYKLPLPTVKNNRNFEKYIFTFYSGIGVGRFFKVPQVSEDSITSLTTSTEGISSLLGLASPDSSLLATSLITTTDTGLALGADIVYKNEVDLTEYAKACLAKNPEAKYFLVGYNSRWSSKVYSAYYYRLTGQGYLMNYTYKLSLIDIDKPVEGSQLVGVNPYLVGDSGTSEITAPVSIAKDEFVIYKLPLPKLADGQKFESYIFSQYTAIYSGADQGRFYKVPQVDESQISALSTSSEGIKGMIGLLNADALVYTAIDGASEKLLDFTTEYGNARAAYESKIDLTSYANECANANPNATYFLVGFNSNSGTRVYPDYRFEFFDNGCKPKCDYKIVRADVSDIEYTPFKTVASSYEGTYYDAVSTYAPQKENTYKLLTKLDNNSSSPETVLVVFAKYDATKKLSGVSVKSVKLEAGESDVDVVSDAVAMNGEAGTLKAFVMNQSNCKPLAGQYALAVK